MKKIISFSVYGNGAMYNQGMIDNAKLAPEIYPGWTVRIYCGPKVTCKKKLLELDCEVVEMHNSLMHEGMFWRFYAAWDTSAERVIFRDSDSRLNVREAEAVKAWEKSGMKAHAMHDHPHHCNLPFSGGMWGIKVGVLPESIEKITRTWGRQAQKRVKDMRFLNEYVYPLVKDSTLHHSSQVLKKWKFKPFPPHDYYDGFVGQQYDDMGKPIWPKVL